MKPSLTPTWFASAIPTVAILVVGGVLAGPFGLTIMGMGTLLLCAPLVFVVITTSTIVRRAKPSLLTALLALVLGWLTALVVASLLGVLLAALPRQMNSDYTPFFTWFTLLGPFASIGFVVGSVVHVVRWAQYRRARPVN